MGRRILSISYPDELDSIVHAGREQHGGDASKFIQVLLRVWGDATAAHGGAPSLEEIADVLDRAELNRIRQGLKDLVDRERLVEQRVEERQVRLSNPESKPQYRSPEALVDAIINELPSLNDKRGAYLRGRTLCRHAFDHGLDQEACLRILEKRDETARLRQTNLLATPKPKGASQ